MVKALKVEIASRGMSSSNLEVVEHTVEAIERWEDSDLVQWVKIRTDLPMFIKEYCLEVVEDSSNWPVMTERGVR